MENLFLVPQGQAAYYHSREITLTSVLLGQHLIFAWSSSKVNQLVVSDWFLSVLAPPSSYMWQNAPECNPVQGVGGAHAYAWNYILFLFCLSVGKCVAAHRSFHSVLQPADHSTACCSPQIIPQQHVAARRSFHSNMFHSTMISTLPILAPNTVLSRRLKKPILGSLALLMVLGVEVGGVGTDDWMIHYSCWSVSSSLWLTLTAPVH